MKPSDSFRDIITSCEERYLSMNCQAFLIGRLYKQLQDKNQGTRYCYEKGMRRTWCEIRLFIETGSRVLSFSLEDFENCPYGKDACVLLFAI